MVIFGGIFLILAFFSLGFVLLMVMGVINGFELFGYSWYTIQYYVLLLPFVGIVFLILGVLLLIFGLRNRK